MEAEVSHLGTPHGHLLSAMLVQGIPGQTTGDTGLDPVAANGLGCQLFVPLPITFISYMPWWPPSDHTALGTLFIGSGLLGQDRGHQAPGP